MFFADQDVLFISNTEATRHAWEKVNVLNVICQIVMQNQYVQAYFTEAAVRSNQTNSKVTNMAKKRNYI
jgi:hypothetical protein